MTFIDHDAPPAAVDRVIVHQFDPSRPSPGGIDTCLRGILRYLSDNMTVAVVGVDTGAGPSTRALRRWERHRLGDREFWFLPVVRLDPADQARRIPHSVRLMAGVIRSRSRIPQRRIVQVHRMDSALALRALLRAPQVYCIHTQENGLVSTSSDSFWRYLGGAHKALERSVVRAAQAVFVFNEDYARTVAEWNSRAVFLPTWYDPALTIHEGKHDRTYSLLWVGRLEDPKDPLLAVRTLEALMDIAPDHPWSLDLLGSGTLFDEVAGRVEDMPEAIRARVHLHGRVGPVDVAEFMSRADVFLMTSFPGYEGYARVLVEAMASGLPAVVTSGSDTGGLIIDAQTGYVCSRAPEELARAVQAARAIDRAAVASAVRHLDAPTLVGEILNVPATTRSEQNR